MEVTAFTLVFVYIVVQIYFLVSGTSLHPLKQSLVCIEKKFQDHALNCPCLLILKFCFIFEDASFSHFRAVFQNLYPLLAGKML